ncbi:MAG TPA: hypothetical protein PKD52_03055 [Clostridiales bacterium]|nr:hypothetical protein [Clostridiales bacterium]
MKKLLISIVILLMIIGGIYMAQSQKTKENMKEQTLFSLEQSSVSEIATQNGTTGQRMAYRDAEDIRKIIEILNDFSYTKMEEVPPADGWSYRVIITMTEDENIDFYLRDTSDVYMENTCYSSAKKDYFAQLIHNWMPK